MPAEAFIPLLLVAGTVLVAGDRLRGKTWANWLVVFMLAVVLLRYLEWRFFTTVLPADISSLQGIFVWFVFTIELLVWLDTAILFAFLLRRTDRTPEADAHEQRLLALHPLDLPEVDVFIATYNEPPEVLEKTIVGALALDWPRARLNVWVLDDGRRDWLRRLAEETGAGYLTRADNADAKAGNINAAVARTSAPFFLVLDADFIPQENFLFRAMGFFDDPRIGIVQIPHNFYNPDPTQTSLNMSKVMPDDQRFFFEDIMPGRDGYDCAFCCGSNGIVRRSALEEIGNRLPSGSITEDMLLTLALKRKGYITRYLDERLAVGLAPENIVAFFIQRARWARGAIQIMFLRDGPFGGKGLKLHERLFFLPLHWVTQSIGQSLAMIVPVIFLLTGLPPLINVTVEAVITYQLTVVVATIAAVRHFAPGEYHPLATAAHSVLQAFRLVPVVVATLIKPHGHAFKVTPKGGEGTEVTDRFTVSICLLLCALMALGLTINANPTLQIVPFPHLLPVVGFWAVVNMILLLLVAKIAVTPPLRRSEERFEITEEVRLHLPGLTVAAETRDMSLSGARLHMVSENSPPCKEGDWVGVEIAEVGILPARIMHRTDVPDTGTFLSIAFSAPMANAIEKAAGHVRLYQSAWHKNAVSMRRRLTRKLFTAHRTRRFGEPDGWRIGIDMLAGIFTSERTPPKNSSAETPENSDPVPAWLRDRQRAHEAMLDEDWERVSATRTTSNHTVSQQLVFSLRRSAAPVAPPLREAG